MTDSVCSRLCVVVCGLGSIGRRHTRNLLERGDVDVVLWRTRGRGNEWGLPEVYRLPARGIDAVIVAVPTSLHAEVLEQVLRLEVAVLCEKPLAGTRSDARRMLDLVSASSVPRRVALNMRFHPCVQKAREWVRSDRIGVLRSARFAVGQYLPDWRPGSDHRESYSANSSLGGGVTLDLIHEVDVAEFVAGPRRGPLAAIVARVGDVTVDTEDVAEILYRSEDNVVVSVHLDYLQRGFFRQYRLIGDTGTIEVDVLAATVVYRDERGDVAEIISFPTFDRNDMYVDLLESFLSEVRGTNSTVVLPSFAESMRTLDTVLEAKECGLIEGRAK